jgi:hypothetical protein
MHIKNILEEGELQEISVCKDFLHTAADGKNYEIAYYNLVVRRTFISIETIIHQTI